jgi:hypothetical protein
VEKSKCGCMLLELYFYNLKKPGTFGVRTELCSTHKTETVPGKPGRLRSTYIQGGKCGRHFLPKIVATLYGARSQKLQLLIVTVERASDLYYDDDDDYYY